MDNEYEVLQDALRDDGLTLNTTTADKHVPQIERQIKVVNEWVHSTWNLLPYQKFPNQIISHMVENAVFWLNTLPVDSGMS